ncbi:MAG: DUF3037 domain-containing protein [Jatrophihabitans sp.]
MRVPFEYAVIRVVPRVERGESINAGVILFCRERDYLGGAVHLDTARLRALDAEAPVEDVAAALDSIVASCGTDADGPALAEEIGRRFRWLTAPRSTIVQPGPVHTGITDDPGTEIDRLLGRLVR